MRSLIGTKRTNRAGLAMSVDWGGPEVVGRGQNDANDPTETLPIDYCALRGPVLYAILYEDRRAPCLARVMTVSYG